MTQSDYAADVFRRLRAVPEPAAAPAQAPRVAAAPSGNTAYVERVVQLEVEAVAGAAEGTRNDTLNRAAFNLGTLVGGGELNADAVAAALLAAATRAGLGEGEARATIASGLRSGAQNPRTAPEPTTRAGDDLGWVGAVDKATGEIAEATMPDAGTVSDFWTAREPLRVIRQASRARMTAPWATLGNALANVVAATPHDIALPPTVGGHGSLNIFVGLVGPSGSGKGASGKAAAHAIDTGGDFGRVNVGTGEGIVSAFVQPVRGGGQEWVRRNCLINVAEIDTLTAVAKRQGATIMPVLRSAWSGETLGFQNRDRATALHVPEMEYRLALVAGIQPGRAEVLLGDADGGTPQRFMWMPSTDPDMNLPDCDDPAPWHWRGFGDLRHADAFGLTVMTIPGHVADQVRNERLAVARGQADAHAGHDTLARLKIAAALACLDSRMEVRDEDWQLSGVVQAVSLATRGAVARRLAEVRRRANSAAGEAEAARAVVVDEAREEAAIKRVSRRVLSRLQARGPSTARDLKAGISSRDRGYIDAALDRLAASGQVQIRAESKAGTDVFEVAE